MLELERNTPESWVMEKSLWDNIVYGSFSIKDKETMNVLRNLSINNANYDLVFYCPIQFPIPDDGLRSLNVDFQKTVDVELRKLLKNLKVKFHELSGNEKQCLDKALKIIDKFSELH